MPDFEKREAEVKLNIANLKREKVLLDRDEALQAAHVKGLLEGMKDASEFNKWRAEMDQRDEILHMEYIQKKKIEMGLAREQAVIAK